MKFILINIIILCLVISSCDKRDWDNPYDPECPKELFTPNGLNAVQEGNLIKLSWSQNNKLITKYQISRNANGGLWTEISNTHTGFTTYTDPTPIVGGVTYGYKVIAVAGENPSNAIQTTIKAISAPTITTNTPANITANSATLGGNVTSDGGATVIERGIVFSTKTNPTIDDNRVTIGTGSGSYNKVITGLLFGTNYFVRAYAINVVGTSYGDEIQFTTPTTIPSLSTDPITIFSDNAANVGGMIISNGGNDLIQAGICYDTAPNPTTSNNFIAISFSNDTLSGTIKNLISNTTYYVRAYAINSNGIAFGNQVSFKTDPELKDLDDNTYKTVIIGDQVWMAENLRTTKYQDGAQIPYSDDGLSWSTQTEPAYCYYNNDLNLEQIHGKLYNWFTVIDNHKLCPAGWHVPSQNEFIQLLIFLGGGDIAGGKLKNVSSNLWNAPNTGATNESGFDALPSGNRNYFGNFDNSLGNSVAYWSSQGSGNFGYNLVLRFDSGEALMRGWGKLTGNPVRCIKDND